VVRGPHVEKTAINGILNRLNQCVIVTVHTQLVEGGEICREPQVERIVPVYYTTDVLGLQAFLRENFYLWAGNGSCVEDIWKSYKDTVFEGIKRYVPQTILSKNPDPGYYNKEVKRLNP